MILILSIRDSLILQTLSIYLGLTNRVSRIPNSSESRRRLEFPSSRFYILESLASTCQCSVLQLLAINVAARIINVKYQVRRRCMNDDIPFFSFFFFFFFFYEKRKIVFQARLWSALWRMPARNIIPFKIKIPLYIGEESRHVYVTYDK